MNASPPSQSSPPPSPLVLSRAFHEQIEREGAEAYPNECCGILFGRDAADRRIVEQLEPVRNEFDAEERYHRFLITPDTLMRAEKLAAAEGRLVLGFYHSHPDHPARPSEYDRQHAWPFYSYVIVSIAGRAGDGAESTGGGPQAVDLTCWLLDEQTDTFARQEIIEDP